MLKMSGILQKATVLPKWLKNLFPRCNIPFNAMEHTAALKQDRPRIRPPRIAMKRRECYVVRKLKKISKHCKKNFLIIEIKHYV